jgi:MFS family permease
MSTGLARPPDVWLLFVTRTLRLLAYGGVSLILVLYLAEVGLDDARIGLLLTLTLAGDTLLSLGITTRADRVGRKWMLVAGAGLMVLGGAVFAATAEFLVLLAAATVGVISPSGNEVGPFLAIEQAALAQVVPPERRTQTFAWYNLAGSFATAAGSLLCGLAVQALQANSVRAADAYRAVLLAYAAAGLLLAVLFTRLSPAAEAPPPAPAGPASRPGWLGLHRSRGVVLALAALFSLDAFAGGFVLQSVMVFWFRVRFGADAATLGGVFFAANLLAGVSALAAAAVARRVGLLRTMVYTHVPSNLLLLLVPFMPTLPSAVAVLLARFAISQMDVPARQAYTAAVVDPDERSAAAGVTGVARTTGAALSPALAGVLLGTPALLGAPFVVAGVLKLLYDGLLFLLFRRTVPPEEAGPDVDRGGLPLDRPAPTP